MGMGDDTNKPLNKREVTEKLEELEKKQTASQEQMEQRLLKLETNFEYLCSLYHDMETILCCWTGNFNGETGKLSIKDIAELSAQMQALRNELYEKKQESEEFQRRFMAEKAETDKLRKKQIEQEFDVQKLREKLDEKNAQAEKWNNELADEKKKVEALDKELIAKRTEAEDLSKEFAAVKMEMQKLEEKLAIEKTTTEAAKTETEKWQSLAKNLKADAETKRIEVESLADKLKLKQEEADHLQTEYIKIQNSIKEAYEKNKALKQEKEEAEQLFGKKKRELEELKAKSEKLKEELEESSKEMERLHLVINNLKEEREEKIAQTNALKQDLLHEQNITRQFQDKFGCWKEETEDYKILLEAVFACDSLTDMMQECGLNKKNGPEDVANLIHFVNLLGDGASFLPILYGYLESYKARNREAVTQEEKELFSLLNLYYRNIYGISCDMIRYPQAGDKFEKSLMKDFDNRTKIFRSIECVYVPSVMRDENSYLMLALVKGVL